MGHRGGMEHDPGKMLSRMSKAIELSSEQQVEVEILLTDSNQANAPDRTRLQELRTEI